MAEPRPGYTFFSVSNFLRSYRALRNMWQPPEVPEPPPPVSVPTNFGKLVVDALAGMTQTTGSIDQRLLRMYLSLASSYLVMDSSMNNDGGIASWNAGFHRLVDVMSALHSRGELELETVNEASKACSECWSIAASYRGMDQCQKNVRDIAAKLKLLLDSNGRTFQGNEVYSPS